MSDPVSRDLRPRAPVDKVTVYNIHKRHKYHSTTGCKFILGKEGVATRVVTLDQYFENACAECFHRPPSVAHEGNYLRLIDSVHGAVM
jgi:hypothetical protein